MLCNGIPRATHQPVHIELYDKAPYTRHLVPGSDTIIIVLTCSRKLKRRVSADGRQTIVQKPHLEYATYQLASTSYLQ